MNWPGSQASNSPLQNAEYMAKSNPSDKCRTCAGSNQKGFFSAFFDAVFRHRSPRPITITHQPLNKAFHYRRNCIKINGSSQNKSIGFVKRIQNLFHVIVKNTSTACNTGGLRTHTAIGAEFDMLIQQHYLFGLSSRFLCPSQDLIDRRINGPPPSICADHSNNLHRQTPLSISSSEAFSSAQTSFASSIVRLLWNGSDIVRVHTASVTG